MRCTSERDDANNPAGRAGVEEAADGTRAVGLATVIGVVLASPAAVFALVVFATPRCRTPGFRDSTARHPEDEISLYISFSACAPVVSIGKRVRIGASG